MINTVINSTKCFNLCTQWPPKKVALEDSKSQLSLYTASLLASRHAGDLACQCNISSEGKPKGWKQCVFTPLYASQAIKIKRRVTGWSPSQWLLEHRQAGAAITHDTQAIHFYKKKKGGTPEPGPSSEWDMQMFPEETDIVKPSQEQLMSSVKDELDSFMAQPVLACARHSHHAVWTPGLLSPCALTSSTVGHGVLMVTSLGLERRPVLSTAHSRNLEGTRAMWWSWVIVRRSSNQLNLPPDPAALDRWERSCFSWWNIST